MKVILSLAIGLASVLAGNGVTGCHKGSPSVAGLNQTDTTLTRKDTTVLKPPTDSAGYTYLALGDSYTIGQNVEATERFPYLTKKLLDAQSIKIKEPRYIAVTGWTTANLQAGIAAQEPLGTYDIVTLLIGVNDQYQHLDTAGYRTRFTQLLQKAISLTGNLKTHLFVLSIPDYSATPYVSAGYKAQVSAEINAFNTINKQITLANGITYIDITPLTRDAANNLSLLASDGLHYSGKEHQKWADLLAPLVKESLK